MLPISAVTFSRYLPSGTSPTFPLFLFRTTQTLLGFCSHSLVLLSLIPRVLPCGSYALRPFSWLLPYLLPLHHPALHLLLTKGLPNPFGQCLDSTGGCPASPIFREKPHTLHFHHPYNTLPSEVSIFVLQHLLQKQLTVTSCLMYTNHPNAESQYITGINSCSRKQ